MRTRRISSLSAGILSLPGHHRQKELHTGRTPTPHPFTGGGIISDRGGGYISELGGDIISEPGAVCLGICSIVGYRGNCGNIWSAIGPYAVDEGLVNVTDGRRAVRIHNTNTGKIIEARFDMRDGRAVVSGDYAIQGVAGTGAAIELAFKNPGGATTGRLFPTGQLIDILAVQGLRTPLAVTMMDVSNPVVFVRAEDMAITGNEQAAILASDGVLIELFESVRRAAAVAMGLAKSEHDAGTKMKSLPLVAIVSAARSDESDITVRMVSSGQPHKATPLTGAMCLAAAAKIPGTVPNHVARFLPTTTDVRIAHASGVLPISASLSKDHGAWAVTEAIVYRTARRLMDGFIYEGCPSLPQYDSETER